MNDTAKKALWIVLAVVAIAAAGGSGIYFMHGDQVHVERSGLGKPKPGQLWGKAAMMSRDRSQGPGGVAQGSTAP